MESEKLSNGDFLSAGSYHDDHHRNSVGDQGRDERLQAGDFLRGSRGDEPPSALIIEQTTTRVDRPSGGEQTQSSSASQVPAAEKCSGHAETLRIKGMPEDLAGGEANGHGVEQERSPRRLPHKEVPQPGQYVDMDAVVEFVALGD